VRRPDEQGPIRLAEKIMAVLAEGSFTSTYKYAVILGLMDLCLENTSRSGTAPNLLTTRQLAEKVVELYWSHTLDFHHSNQSLVLKQNGSRPNSQIDIINKISQFRQSAGMDATAPLSRARSQARRQLETLFRKVELKLIEMPLARLQLFGGTEDRFLYEIAWTRQDIEGESFKKLRRMVRDYQNGDTNSGFDNRILLQGDAGFHLVLLNGLLRPLIHQQWAAMVSRLNKLDASRLEDFLFGTERISTTAVRDVLWRTQDQRCFYCQRQVRSIDGCEVDHFIPWSRYPDNGIQNLVVAHDKCNRDKRDYLVAAEHVSRWVGRFSSDSDQGRALISNAKQLGWESNPRRTVGVARAIYWGLPADARLWLQRKEFVPADLSAIRESLSAAS